MLQSIYQQIWKTQQWPQDWKRSVFIPIPKKGNAKECSTAAAATAKSLQSCPTLCDPIDGSPPGSSVLGILQARTLEWLAISFSNAWKWKVKVKSLSCVLLCATPWTASYQASPPMGFSRQEYWSGLPLPSPFLWDWNENWPFPVLWLLLSFPNLLTYWVQHSNIIF